MVGRQDRQLRLPPRHLLHAAMDRADRRLGQEIHQRGPPQRHDQLRPDQSDLLVDPRPMRADLRHFRRPVSRRPARHDVRDVHRFPRDPGRFEQPVQVGARTAYERTPLLILLRARRFPDQQHIRTARP